MTLDRDDIVAGLGELAGELDAAGLELTIHVVGGAAIALEYNTDRQATSDIDAWVNARPVVRYQVVEGLHTIEDVQETFDGYYPHDDMKPLSRHWLEENLPHRTP
jgi:hypothetical protein